MPTLVSLEDLEDALMLVSDAPGLDTKAYVSCSTGRIYACNIDGPLDKDFPDDIDDCREYIAIPHKNDLNLGRRLAQQFIEEYAPQAASEVDRAFRRKGAYSRFKSLLVQLRLLDAWHRHENESTAAALEEWARSHGFEVTRSSNSGGTTK